MKVVLRADSGIEQGTGHLMRCLTLSEELVARGHEVELVTSALTVPWLVGAVTAAAIPVHECNPDELSSELLRSLRPDWVVVDSYRISADEISRLAAVVRVLAIVDNDHRGIDAALYLDQNLGAELIDRPKNVEDKFLSGARFALVRDALLTERKSSGEVTRTTPNVLCFMGGTDPTRASLAVAAALASLPHTFRLTVLAPLAEHPALADVLVARADVDLRVPTLDLPSLLGASDLVISAAGTSAWDVCAIGVPALLVAVVANQQPSVREAVRRGLVLGLDAALEPDSAYEQVGQLVSRLLDDRELRERLSRRCLEAFDGLGKVRVVDALENIVDL
jgi:spore coat polysaccharide biosynthesis predicted glycosyltransferase SpsG